MKKSILLLSFLAGLLFLAYFYSTENLKVQKENNSIEVAEMDYSGPAQFEIIHNMIRTTEGQMEPQYKIGDRIKELNKALARTSLTKSDEDFNWVERGPANVSGRTRGLLVDPDDPSARTWFAASVGGGVWKTEDAGGNWRLLTENFTSLATNTIAMSPANTQVIYVGTGEGIFSLPAIIGTGIWKSMDKGETWEILESTASNSDFAFISRMIVNPDNENEILVSAISESVQGSRRSTVYKSVDGGETWDLKFQINNMLIQQIVATTQDFNDIYITINRNGVFRTQDAGESWTKVWSTPNEERRIEMAISNQDAGVIYLSCEIEEGSRLYFTRDTFDTFTETIYKGSLEPNWLANQGWYDNTIAVHPYNDSLVWVAGQRHMFQLAPGTEFGTVLRYDDFEVEADFIEPIEDGPFVDEAGGLTSSLFGGLPVTFQLEEDDLIDAEIRFGDGIKSMSHLVSIVNPVTFEFAYTGFIEVPFQVWDIDNNIQLASTVVDGDFSGEWTFDEYDGGQLLDAILINTVEYSETENQNIANTNPFYKALYYFLASKSSDFEGSIDSLPEGVIKFSTRLDEGLLSNFVPITNPGFDFDNVPFGSKGVHVDHHNITFIPRDEATQSFYVLNGNDGGVAFSEDNGDTFIQTGDTFNDGSAETSKGYNTSQFYGVDKMNGANRFIAGTQDNGSWISDEDPDENSIWTPAPSGDGFEAAWNYGNTDQILESSQFNNIFKSFDAGLSWQNVELPESEGPFVTRIASSQLAPDLIFMVSDSGVLRSPDFADSWEIIDMPEEWQFNRSFGPPITISLADPSFVWTGSRVSSSSRICYSDDGGLTFNSTPRYTLAELGVVTGIATHPSDPNIAYALFSQANGPKILKTEDLGQTWTDISGFVNNVSASANGFPNVAVYSLLVMPWNEDIIWAGTEIGIFESRNGGESWEFANNNLPSVSVWQMKIVNDELVIATHGRGIWTLNTNELMAVNIKEPNLAEVFNLSVYPNPVSDKSTIKFTTEGNQGVEIELLDLSGRKIQTIYNGSSLNGQNEIEFYKANQAAGTYIIKLKINGQEISKKVIFV